MAKDIVPDLLNQIKKDFNTSFNNNEKLKKIRELIEKGEATYSEAYDYAEEAGQLLADVFKRNLSSEVLPDGRMYYNIASEVVGPALKNNHDIITKLVAEIQTDLNRGANLGIKGLTTKANQDGINQIVGKIANEPIYDDVAWILDKPIITFTLRTVDDTLQKNLDFQKSSGLNPKIVRVAHSGACKWCRGLVGSYRYPEDTPDDVFKRHNDCRCKTEYDPGDSTRQNVWKQSEWRSVDEKAKIEERKKIGLSKQQIAKLK